MSTMSWRKQLPVQANCKLAPVVPYADNLTRDSKMFVLNIITGLKNADCRTYKNTHWSSGGLVQFKILYNSLSSSISNGFSSFRTLCSQPHCLLRPRKRAWNSAFKMLTSCPTLTEQADVTHCSICWRRENRQFTSLEGVLVAVRRSLRYLPNEEVSDKTKRDSRCYKWTARRNFCWYVGSWLAVG